MMIRGLYVHIPFCSYKCPYCDFTSLVRSPVGFEDYTAFLLREAELYRDLNIRLETLYLGGGTPTLLSPGQIGALIDKLGSIFDLSGLKEVTVECNPETYRYEEFRELLRAGVNRLSLGVQSFSEEGLKRLGREHSVQESLEAYLHARDAGFENVSIDIIYGYPGQRVEDMEIELESIGELNPDHVSAYMLTPHENTPMGMKILGGELEIPEEETLGDIYDRLWKGLKGLGYERYEVSNWAKGGKECRHNLLYWTMEEFLGLGVSAWGFFGGRRYGNTKNILSYVKALSEGRRPLQSEVLLSEEDLFEEELMLRLRLKWGLGEEDIELIPERLRGFFEIKGGRLGIREEYMLLSNEIITEVLLYNSDRNSTEVRNG